MSALRRAQAAIELERYAEAGSLLSSYLAENPDDAEGLCLLARARLGIGDQRGGLAAANAAVAADPALEWPHRIASLALSQLGLTQEAVRASQEAVRLAPDAWQTHARLARTLADVAAYQPGWDAAMRAVAIAPDEPQTHQAAGDVALLAGWLTLAEQAYRRALALDPTNAAVLNDLGLVDERRGRVTSAMTRFSGAARLDPGDSTSARNVEVMGWRLLRGAALVAPAVLVVAFLTGGGTAPESGWSPARAWCAAAAAVVLGVCGLVLRRRLPAVARPVLRRMVTHTRWGLIWLAVQLAGLIVLVAFPWTSEGGRSTAFAVVFYGAAVAFLAASAGSRRVPTRGDTVPAPPHAWFGGEPGPLPGRAFSWRRRGRSGR